MFMRMKQPKRVRTLLAQRKRWMTIEEIAGGLEMHRNTVRKLLKGKNIDPATALKVADAVGEDVMEIAEFVEA